MQIGAKAIDQADALLPFLHFVRPLLTPSKFNPPPTFMSLLDSTAQSVMAITISTDPLVEPTHPEARLDNPHHP
ncbi:hypothetical protein PGTUg99_010434 [Puccinia graminis f. sp. tritici]|uniref:Uncharacterized protein n=1 Tax=Puccinia graminis f. sp. tritici TaxID=56615 RepID=A0A5B0NR88_PUCGR|nr:hypothetical protein PGTUg99_010434 [Puccinia graminis f. sp. tritici]